MSQLVKVPRFWVNWVEYFQNNNINIFSQSEEKSRFNTLPVDVKNFDNSDNVINSQFDLDNYLNNPFIAVLGHSSFGQNRPTIIKVEDIESEISKDGIMINEDLSKSGWGLFELSSSSINRIKIHTIEDNNIKNAVVCNVIVGSYWDAPHSPDLNLTISYDFSGTKKQETKGGSLLTNTLWDRPPKWGEYGNFEIAQGQNHNLTKMGRRSWNLTFSFLSQSNVFPETLNSATLADNNATDDALLTGDNDFIGQVLTPTMGGKLPFLFSHDSTSSALDNFAICTIDQKTFSIRQTAPDLYRMSLKIVETW